MLFLLLPRRTLALPSRIRKSSRPGRPSSHSVCPAGTRISSPARAMLRRSFWEQAANSGTRPSCSRYLSCPRMAREATRQSSRSLGSMPLDLSTLAQPAATRILLVVLDGLGGYADRQRGSELEEAATPSLDALAAEGATGLVEPVGAGITPGSGPGHLGLFGYDPLEFELGRGALSAAGLDFELRPGDVAARGNLCTLGADGTVADRRAGRLPDDEAAAVVAKLQDGVHLDGAEVFFRHEREHRLLLVLRGPGLDPALTDTDPQHEGVAPLDPQPIE